MSHGYNPLRWDCEKRGCFNLKCRPKIEEFADCLPGKIAFSDIDAITEVGGRFLLLEWKSHDGEIPTGQRIMYERMTRLEGFTVVVVAGNAETMEVRSLLVFSAGQGGEWQGCTFEGLKSRIRAWAQKQ